MVRNSSSKSSTSNNNSSASTGSSIFQNLRRLTNPSSNHTNKSPSGSSPRTSYSPERDSTTTRESHTNSLKPLNKKTSLNTQNLSQYINDKHSPQHTRSASVQSSSKYSYSRRSSSQTLGSTLNQIEMCIRDRNKDMI